MILFDYLCSMSPGQIANIDINKYLRERGVEKSTHIGNYKFDVWVVTDDWLFNKEQRRLNRELGLWGVNKTKENKNMLRGHKKDN